MSNSTEVKQAQRMKWWTEAKFGMFVHWGLYAIPGQGEWQMYSEKIPVKEYEKLAGQFNPVRFDAREWVRIAKEAGMKYIVITAKHHDGFAMYSSSVEPFNIVDATPFKRDPMKELAEACREEGIRLCFYYSHVIDWHHPHSVHNAANNTWDYRMEEKDFPIYWNSLAKPQIRELLTQYGPVGLLWFDTAGGLSKEDSEDMVAHVRSLQPECLVNSRVSHFKGMGDYQSKGDNETPMYGEDERPWETPMTLNRTWGFSPKDQVWKTTESLVRKLVHIVSKGGNLLLNVGPSPEGTIPGESVERLKELGEWTGRNAEAIYAASASPFPYEFDWGAITAKPGKLYLHIHNDKWPKTGKLVLRGVRNRVSHAYLLADPGKRALETEQTFDDGLQLHTLAIGLPAQAPDSYVSVVVLELEGENDIDSEFTVLPSGSLKVDIPSGRLTEGHEIAGIEGGGPVRKAEWSVMVPQPGTYRLSLVSFRRTDAVLEEGFKAGVELVMNDRPFVGIPKEDRIITDSPACQHPYSEVHSIMGEVEIPRPGHYSLTLKSALIKERHSKFTEIWQADPVKLRSVMLVRI
ncbi:Alpha-L-fucosidase [Chlamydia abortus]|nr:alpha-L-fucosidase [Aneurinibacillus sp. XH2]SHE11528.1 Alpha-L-fucosidase [Chlamydia abortus]